MIFALNNCFYCLMDGKIINAFFTLLRAGLWEQGVRLSPYEPIDFLAIYELAKEQSVVGLIAAGLEYVEDIKLSKKDALLFIGHTLQLEQQNSAMNRFIGVLVNKMHAEGINTVLVKGQGVARCYLRPLWRACGDVDLFLSDDNYEKAKQLLIPLATSVEGEYVRERHQGMIMDSWVVELHGRLYCGLSSRVERVLDDVQQSTFCEGNVRLWMNENVQVFLLSAENDAFYVFTHILQHFYKGGIGLRQICDWCRLLWTYREMMDLKVLEKHIHNAGLVTEWKAFGYFAVEYLGMPMESMPLYSSEKKWKSKAKRICSFIIDVGNFGHKRDRRYFEERPYLIRKAISMGRRIGDLFRHSRIFPMDSILFLPSIVINGLKSAMRGE